MTYECPLRACGWTYTPPPIQTDATTLAAVFGPRIMLDIHRVERALLVEAELEEHLSSHDLAVWVREVRELRQQLRRGRVLDGDAVTRFTRDAGTTG